MAFNSENIQGHTLEVRVHGGTKLKNTVKVGKQDPFVELIYGESNYKIKPCRGGDTSPTFNDKFIIELVQGFREIKITVYSRNALDEDDFIGEGVVSLSEVLGKGYHEANCLIFKDSWSAGEISLTLIYPNAQVSYEDMRAVKEKAEDLVSYRASDSVLGQENTSVLELENMRLKMVEMEKELTTFISELRKADKQKQLIMENSELKMQLYSMKNDLQEKEEMLNSLSAVVGHLKNPSDAGCRTCNIDIHEFANQQLIKENSYLKMVLHDLEIRYAECVATNLKLKRSLMEREKVKQQLVAAMRRAVNMMKHIESSMTVPEKLKAKMQQSIMEVQHMSKNMEGSKTFSHVFFDSSVLPKESDVGDSD